jgi:hypothetical protein
LRYYLLAKEVDIFTKFVSKPAIDTLIYASRHLSIARHIGIFGSL